MVPRKILCDVKGLSEAKAEKAIAGARTVLSSGYGFMSGADLLVKRASVIKISTGSQAFDELLGGGIESMSISEVFGEYRTGKTQLCHTMAVTAQHIGKVIYIDTEGTFRPERLTPIVERFGFDISTVLDNIIYARAYTHEQQMELLDHVSAKLSEERFALIIVDSVTALFRVDFSGRGELAERQQKLGKYLSRLTKLSEEFNVAVLMSNQVCADPAGGPFAAADAKKPIGGHILAHASTTRLMLRKGRGNMRIVKVFDSPSLPESEATYAITEGGIADESV
eukprot:gnl/Ergobibamus_cyprinoides/1444.p1 GENE.gnl/Ergobibamus_cyprinoides/1444~~gnl/Ergobibamus_cyprinoides/1444.p1  ORF type:complete len:297 (+),score=81.35 gnl/Ergobibamus_cyprinoides/1444:47-892(+)